MKQDEYIHLMQNDPEKFNSLRIREKHKPLIIKGIDNLKISHCCLKNIQWKTCHSGQWKTCHSGQWEACHSGQWEACNTGQWKACHSGQWEACYYGQIMISSDISLKKSYIITSWCQKAKHIDCPINDIEAYIHRFNLEVDSMGRVKMYKTVQDDNSSFYDPEIIYKKGAIMECPDWDDDYYGACGSGFHLCPTPKKAKEYSDGKIKSFWVYTDNFRIYVPDLSKIRAKKVEVID